MQKKREVYIDVLRIAACMCVIYTHVNEKGLFVFAQYELGSWPYWLNLFLSVCCKLAVPVFFAISGAMILHKEPTFKSLLLRILKTGGALVLFSTVYYAVEVARGTVQPGLKTYIFGMYDSTWNYAYWYLYAYLAFLMMSPAIGAMVRGLSDRWLLYLLAVGVFFRILPGLEYLRWQGAHSLYYEMDMRAVTCDMVLYPCMGYYLHRRLSRQACRRIAPVLCAAAVIMTGVACYMNYWESYCTGMMHMQKHHERFAPILCAAVFAAARGLLGDADADSRAGRMVTLAGQCTFGVYLLHKLCLETLPGREQLWAGMSFLPAALASGLYCAVILLVCMAVTLVLRRIPGVRWLLG